VNSEIHKTKISRAYAHITKRETDCGPYWQGHIYTHHGIVEFYRQTDAKRDAKPSYAQMKFVWKGHLYTRVWEKFITDRGAVMLAQRFVDDVLEGES